MKSRSDLDPDSSNLMQVSGICPSKEAKLRSAGYGHIRDLQKATQSELAEVEGIGNALATRIKADVTKRVEYEGHEFDPVEASFIPEPEEGEFIESIYGVPVVTPNYEPFTELGKSERNSLYGQATHSDSMKVDVEPGGPLWKALYGPHPNGRCVPGDLPGEQAEVEHCPNCSEPVHQLDDDFIERNGDYYCDIDCLNEEVSR